MKPVVQAPPSNKSRLTLNFIVAVILCVAISLIFIFSTNSKAPESAVFQPKEYELLEPVGTPKNLTPAQNELWDFIDNYRIIALEKSDAEVLRVTGTRPHFTYLKQNKDSVIGNTTGAKEHIELFLKRYDWVAPVLKKYDLKLEVPSYFKGNHTEICDKYRKNLKQTTQDTPYTRVLAKKIEEFRQHVYENPESKRDLNDILNGIDKNAVRDIPISFRKAQVSELLNIILTIDYMMARGSDNDRELCFKILYKVMGAWPFMTRYEKMFPELELPIVKSILWPIYADHPKFLTEYELGSLFRVFTSLSSVDKNYSADYMNFSLWVFRNNHLTGWDHLGNTNLRQTSIQNMLVHMNELEFAFYWAHMGMTNDQQWARHVTARILLKRIHKKDAKKYITKYNKLLTNAYP